MSDHIEPGTHIDIRVIKNLLISRLNEGRDLMKLASVSTAWKRKERVLQEKCNQAIRLIDEAINAKEGKTNEVSNQTQTTRESNKGNWKTTVQNQENKT